MQLRSSNQLLARSSSLERIILRCRPIFRLFTRICVRKTDSKAFSFLLLRNRRVFRSLALRLLIARQALKTAFSLQWSIFCCRQRQQRATQKMRLSAICWLLLATLSTACEKSSTSSGWMRRALRRRLSTILLRISSRTLTSEPMMNLLRDLGDLGESSVREGEWGSGDAQKLEGPKVWQLASRVVKVEGSRRGCCGEENWVCRVVSWGTCFSYDYMRRGRTW